MTRHPNEQAMMEVVKAAWALLAVFDEREARAARGVADGLLSLSDPTRKTEAQLREEGKAAIQQLRAGLANLNRLNP